MIRFLAALLGHRVAALRRRSHEIPIAWRKLIRSHVAGWSTLLALLVRRDTLELRINISIIFWLPLLGSASWSVRIGRIKNVLLLQLHADGRVVATLSG